MAYTKQTWIDGTSIANAERLNHMESGIFDVANQGDRNQNIIGSLAYNLVPNEAPVKTGRQVDDKDEYVMKIKFDALPNNSYVDIPIGLEKGTFKIHRLEGYAERTTGVAKDDVLPLPYASSATSTMTLLYSASVNSIRIQTFSDRSDFQAYVSVFLTFIE